MKLKEEFIKLPKETLYETYLSIVYNSKDYEKITRSQMLESIIKEYKQKCYLYHICTKKELDFLKYSINKKLTKKDLTEYEWEIDELNKKCIFSKVTFEIFEEQIEEVKKALNYYKEYPNKYEDNVIIFMISTIKTNVQMLTKALIMMTESFFKISDEKINHLLGSPLFHFYCEFSYEYIESLNNEEELISYRDYWIMLEDFKEKSKEFGISGVREFYPDDNYDIFYHSFPIRKESVKLMYETINKLPFKDVAFKIIDIARIFDDREMVNNLFNEKRLNKIINNAIDDMPCAIYSGYTPNEYKKEIEKQNELSFKFSSIPQNNAHLCKNAAKSFYKLYLALLEFTNDKYNVNTNIKKIYKQEGLDVNELNSIDKYLWEHKNIIDEFIKENKYNFNEEELNSIKEFKNAVTDEFFTIIGFDVDYTQILSNDGKIYMVKGITSNLDEIVNPKDLPIPIHTTLLMFEGNIIYNSFLSTYSLSLGNDFKETIIKESEKAIKYYHL